MCYLLMSHEVFSNVLNLAAPHQVTERKSQYFLSIVVAGIIQDFCIYLVFKIRLMVRKAILY